MTKKLIGLYNVRELLKRYTKEQIAKGIYVDVMKKIYEINKKQMISHRPIIGNNKAI